MLELLYAALNSEYGVVVETNDPQRLRTKLYGLRKEDPDLHCLSMTISPTSPANELWIMKRKVDAPAAE